MSFRTRHGIPNLGIGVGARAPHMKHILSTYPQMDWFEVISENYMIDGGIARQNLLRLCERYKVIPHGVSLGIGSVDPPTRDYIDRLRALLLEINPPWFSDHLCWGRANGHDLHDLLPLPMTNETVDFVAGRAKAMQDAMGRPFVLENVSSYVTFRESTMPEWAFVSEVCERADCGILFDVNNVYVSAYNHGFRAQDYIDGVAHDRVVQVHLAGHTDKGTHLLDTHSAPVKDEVLSLYKATLRKTGPVSTLVEWDEDIPAWETLTSEVDRVRTASREVFPQ